jgi:hypothetical protein
MDGSARGGRLHIRHPGVVGLGVRAVWRLHHTTLVLSTDSDLFKFLKGIDPKGDVVPPVRSTEIR